MFSVAYGPWNHTKNELMENPTRVMAETILELSYVENINNHSLWEVYDTLGLWYKTFPFPCNNIFMLKKDLKMMKVSLFLFLDMVWMFLA